MVGTPSGTTLFNLNINEIIEEAYERCGVEQRGGFDARTARRSLNLLLLEWANRGINLWTVTEDELVLTPGEDTYTLGTDIVDLIETMIQNPGASGVSGPIRYNLTRVSVSTQATRTNPNISGRPTEIYVDRQQAAPVVHIWPIPDLTGYTLVYWYLRRIDEAGAYTNTTDVPFRFLPALTAGLAYHLARKVMTADRNDTRWAVQFLEQRIIRLHDDYEAAFLEAAQEDRDRSTLNIVPRGSSYRVGT